MSDDDNNIPVQEKVKAANEAFESFLDSLGPNDVYKQIFLEVLLEEIYGHRVDLSKIFKGNQL